MQREGETKGGYEGEEGDEAESEGGVFFRGEELFRCLLSCVPEAHRPAPAA